MHSVTPAAVSLLIGLFGTCAPAQRTWVVDESFGPGADFIDVPPALIAASDGDTILVRRGSYTTAVTGKALTLLGESGATFETSAFTGGMPFTIAGLPAGRAFVMAGFATYGPTSNSVLECVGNAGRIHLDRLVLSNPGHPFVGSGPGLRVAACAEVSITDCQLLGSPALQVESQSKVAVCGGAIHGIDAFGYQEIAYPSALGLVATSSSVHVARASLRGGSGGIFGSFALSTPPSPGLSATSTALVCAGSPAEFIRAGTYPGGGTYPTSAIVMSGGEMLLDPTLTLLPFAGAPPLGGSGFVLTQRRLPALAVRGDALGGTLLTDLYSPAGHVALLFAALPGPSASTSLGALWLDPATATLVDTAIQSASEHHAVNFAIPADPLLRGLAIGLQSLGGDAASSTYELSNAGIVMLR